MFDINVGCTVKPCQLKNITLLPHQLESIKNMEKREILQTQQYRCDANIFITTAMGINGDITGYGKTLSMIGLICRDSMYWDLDVPYHQETIYQQPSRLITTRSIKSYRRIPTTLVLASITIIHQWVEEIKKTKLTYTVIHKKKDLDVLFAETVDIVLVVPDIYNKLIMMYATCAWKRFIFDEPSEVKVSSMKRVVSGFTWFVSATWQGMYNKHNMCPVGSFMRDVVGKSYYTFLEDMRPLVLVNDPEFVMESFKIPPTSHVTHICINPILRVVSGHISNRVQHLVNIGDIDGAVLALGGNKTSNIVDLIRRRHQHDADVINTRLTSNLTTLTVYEREDLERNYDKLMTKIKDIDSKFAEMLESECMICQETLVKPVLEVNCQNVFCGKCLLRWMREKHTCPACRADITNSSLVSITLETPTMESEKREPSTEQKSHPASRTDTVLNIIKGKLSGKFIIFSEYESGFNVYEKMLTEHLVTFTTLGGSKKTIEDRLKSFRNGPTKVLLLNPKRNGTGINLQETTDIILCHIMPTDTQTQIIGRANRIGRTTPLTVHHIVFEF